MSRGGPGRSLELDGLRTIAIIAMALSHVTRTIRSKVRSAWCEPSLLLDPYIQALFLGLVGASLVWSWSNAQARGWTRAQWLGSRARRAGQVYLVGVLIFFFDKGAQVPYIVIAPGILATIGLAILVYAPVASSRRPMTWALVVSGLGYAVEGWLEHQGIFFAPVNMANAPMLPNAAVTGLGLVAGLALLRGDRRVLGALATLALAGGALLLSRYTPAELLDTPFGRTEHDISYRGGSHGLANTWAMITGTAELDDTTYFNPTVAAQPFVLGMIAATWILLRLLRPLLERVHRWLFLVGRHSLQVYVFHLALVGLPTVIQGRAKPWRQTWTGNLWAVAVILLCYLFAWLWQRRQQRRKPQRKAVRQVF